MENPFKFGTVVRDDFFTDRVEETEQVKQVLSSLNHLVLISPRRFGKTSLICRVTDTLDRPVVYLDLQLLTGVADFAAQLLRRVLKLDKWLKLKQMVASFRIVPTVSFQPLTNEIEVSFQPAAQPFVLLEDVLNMIEQMGERRKRPVVVFDEFQEIKQLDKNLDKQLRSVIQHHQAVNYVFMGSEESMMSTIFGSKKSPFYHFGQLMTLGKISHDDMMTFLQERFGQTIGNSKALAEDILAFSACHPYYTQQMAFYCWTALGEADEAPPTLLNQVIEAVVRIHDKDYELLWNTLNKTDKEIMITLAAKQDQSLRRLSQQQPTSTVYSGLKRLVKQGYIIKNGSFEIDDPFFARWIVERRR